MRDWLESLAPRERIFVLAGAFAVVITLLWLLIWEPLDSGHEQRTESVSTWERSLAELKRVPDATNAGRRSPTITGCLDQTPVVIVDRTLRSRSLDRALKRSQPAGNGIRVEFENVAFDDLVLWLGDLSTQCAMEVQAGTLSTAARSAPGRINANLTLERTL